MDTFKLTTAQHISEEFDFLGDCYLCITGEGAVTIERKLDNENFVAVTNESGVPLSFVGKGVLFNNKLTSGRKIKHRIVADTPSSVLVSMVKERK